MVVSQGSLLTTRPISATLTVPLTSTCRIVPVKTVTRLAQPVVQQEPAAVHHALQEDGAITQPTPHLHALFVTVVVEFQNQVLSVMVSQRQIALYVDRTRI